LVKIGLPAEQLVNIPKSSFQQSFADEKMFQV